MTGGRSAEDIGIGILCVYPIHPELYIGIATITCHPICGSRSRGEPEPYTSARENDDLQADPVPDPQRLVPRAVDASGEEDLRALQVDEGRHERHVLLEPDGRARPHLGEREQLTLLREVNPLQRIGVAFGAHDPRLPVDGPALRALRRRELPRPEVLEEGVDAGELRGLE